MENITNNPGLQHLAENILLNLDHQNLEICQEVNNSFKEILNNSRKFIRRGLPMKNQSEWIKAIQITKDTDLEKPVITYLKKCSKNSRVIAPPYYIDEEFLTTFDELRYLADIANASNAFGQSPIFQAAVEGNLVHVKILVLFADNPNAPDEDAVTPICQATFRKAYRNHQNFGPYVRQSQCPIPNPKMD